MQQLLVKNGAEADIFLTEWGGRKAVSKVRSPKPYRHRELDAEIRRHRTVHEANFLSAAKFAGVRTPYVYFVDPVRAEIIMEFVEGKSVRDVITAAICHDLGRYAALLHSNNIMHGDLTTSNFILEDKGGLALMDFGLAYYSERKEDAATDVRLIKEAFTSAHIEVKKAFENFAEGYSSVRGKNTTGRMLENVKEIERRGRYARVT